jgi:hypothetical protein
MRPYESLSAVRGNEAIAISYPLPRRAGEGGPKGRVKVVPYRNVPIRNRAMTTIVTIAPAAT